ncbi:uncharacterized protein LOC126959391 isoform X2 [Macaca thibetana thibetana]|uniref:uncharacterized protein LOC126959391 isoform X2 n=1 Tax=Macaca thibetana thibetana TaxID=257877 RepID=UPI0021BC3BDE|nr:uncharacterized protein LOC126959391 isoform X2 [Macaca thibetana thibetana]
MELSSMKICTAIPTSRISTVFCFCFSPPPKALPEVVRRMPRKRISGLEALLQQRSNDRALGDGKGINLLTLASFPETTYP